jgi:hypothetical protein
MVKTILSPTIALLVVPAAVHAQSAITGKWQGKTPNGFQLELDLVVTDKELTGTFARDGQALTIAEGKASKTTFTFKVTMNDRTEAFSGEIDGDQMKLWMDRQGPSSAAVLKRVGVGVLGFPAPIPDLGAGPAIPSSRGTPGESVRGFR